MGTTGVVNHATCTYTGRDGHTVTKVFNDGTTTELRPGRSLRLVNHSPTGFSWGYGGSGPSQLALALLLDVTGDPDVALANYHRFKWDIVANWPFASSWSITDAEIRQWLQGGETK